MSSPSRAVRLSIASDGGSSTVDPSVDTSSPLRRALIVDGVRVVLVADIDPDREALDANRRRPVERELQQADAGNTRSSGPRRRAAAAGSP